LSFLKGFPAPLLLSALFLVVMWIYLKTNDAFLQRVIDTILGGLLGVVTGRGISQAGTTATGDVNITPTPEIDLTKPEAIGAVEVLKEEDKNDFRG
jgi:hypothetical protein